MSSQTKLAGRSQMSENSSEATGQEGGGQLGGRTEADKGVKDTHAPDGLRGGDPEAPRSPRPSCRTASDADDSELMGVDDEHSPRELLTALVMVR